MKTYFYTLLSFLLILSSCKDYLENKDGDKVIPSTLKHYDELIYGEIIKQSSGTEMSYLPLMTDDAEDMTVSYYDSDSRVKYFPYYTWAIENQRGLQDAEIVDNAWALFYHKILMCNIVYKEVSALEDDLNGTKNRLLGEVSFLRAMSYFYLVNLYGEPYQNAEQAKNGFRRPDQLRGRGGKHPVPKSKIAGDIRFDGKRFTGSTRLFPKGRTAKLDLQTGNRRHPPILIPGLPLSKEIRQGDLRLQRPDQPILRHRVDYQKYGKFPGR